MNVQTVVRNRTRGAGRLRSPDLANLCDHAWKRCGLVAYRFSRQVRHDVGNQQTAVRMLDLLDQMPVVNPTDLPAEFVGPAAVRRARDAAWNIAAMTNQLVFLANAPNRAAYAPTTRVTIGDLFEQAVALHLPDGGPALSRILSPVASGHVVQMGDMLEAALATYNFQWLPTGGPDQAENLVDARLADHEVQLEMRTSQHKPMQHVCQCHNGQTSGKCCLDTPGDCQTVDLALCLSAHIITVHGGVIDLVEQPDGLRVRIRLPRTHRAG